MSTRNRHGIATALLVALLASSGAARGDGDWLDSGEIGWHHASYHGRKLIFSLEAEVALGLPPPAEVAADLEPGTEVDPLQPADCETVAVRLESTVLGSHSSTLLYADAESAEALQRREIRRKRDLVRYKTLRFADEGVELRFHEPAPGEPADEPRSWSGLSTRFEPYPDWADPNLAISEPTVLFYVLSAAHLEERGDVVRFPALSKEELVMIELEVAGWEQIEVDYLRDGEPIEGPTPALKVLVHGRPLDPTTKGDSLEVMGLRGAIAIHLDRETRAPLRVSGKIPFAGRAEVNIRSLTTR